MPRKYPMRSGLAWISAMRSFLSGTMFSVAIRLNFVGFTTVAVPSQLLPTTRMSWVVVRFVAASADAGSASETRAKCRDDGACVHAPDPNVRRAQRQQWLLDDTDG